MYKETDFGQNTKDYFGPRTSFIKLAFMDLAGQLKNVSVQRSFLPDVVDRQHVIPGGSLFGFAPDEEIRLVPEPETVHPLPWRRAQGEVVRVFCALAKADGTSHPLDTRAFLRKQEAALAHDGWKFQVDIQLPFYLFYLDSDGNVSERTVDRGGYLDVAPADGAETLRREICLTLADMGIPVTYSIHDQGPGQNSITFESNGLLAAADHLLQAKATVRAIAQLNGYYATFLPEPLEGAAANQLTVSLRAEGKNLAKFADSMRTRFGEWAGLSQAVPNSYGHARTPESIRISADGKKLLWRGIDAVANVHALLGLAVATLQDPSRPEPYEVHDFRSAVEVFGRSPFVRKTLGDAWVDAYLGAQETVDPTNWLAKNRSLY